MTSKVYEGRARIELIHGDCMEGMAGMQDNQFNLAIVDPPYGIGESKISRRRSNGFTKHKKKDWDNYRPSPEYFSTLKSISKNQIIWGANYFQLPAFSCSIVWDKKQPEGVTFSMHELAYTSFQKKQSKTYYQSYSSNSNKATNKYSAKKYQRIHPTQKPSDLYKWLLQNYAKPGDTIVDTHGGSMSIAIACWDLGFDLTCYEIDQDYYNAAVERFENHIKQEQLFEPSDFHTNNKQKTLYK